MKPLTPETGPETGPEILPFGQTGILVRFGREFSMRASQAARGFAERVRAQGIVGVSHVNPSLVSVHVGFDAGLISRRELSARLAQLLAAPDAGARENPAAGRRRWHVPAAFGGEDGPQLGEFARLAGRSEADLIAEATGTDLDVLAIGFAPGQPYLGLLPESWDIPRQSTLTPRIPAGTIAAAIRQIVLFANDSPTGWRAIGRVAFRPFVAHRDAPFLLRTGDVVRFTPTSAAGLRALEADPDGLGGAICEDLA